MAEGTLEDRFWERVHKDSDYGCWIWKGCLRKDGYGVFGSPGRIVIGGTVRAHRIAYILLKGEIPHKLVLDHICRNRACCNPRHLRAVTDRENTLVGIGPSAENHRKTHCKRGHEFNQANTHYFKGPKGQPFRLCRICDRAKARRKYYRDKQRKVQSA